jgi:hypothetical protein
MTQDISYFEIGYIVESYFVRIANAESSLSTTSTLSCTGIRAIRIIGDSVVQGQIISPTGNILQTDIYPNYSQVSLAQPA